MLAGEAETVVPIEDVCTCLQSNIDQARRLLFLVEEFGIFHSRGADVSTPPTGLHASRESLDSLLESGAFEKFTFNNFRSKSAEQIFRLEDKRALAVQLGWCFA